MMSPDGIGALLRTVRERAGRSQQEQSKAIEAAQGGRLFDPDNLKRWETERRLPTPVWHETIALAYGLTVSDVRRAVGASRQYRRRQAKEGEDVNRRKFFYATAAAVGAGALPAIA